ncbi:MAG TPA: hypothetical protein ENI87_09550 [bacterium]|nr:hypothetical protein [bacterium]
MSRRADRLLRSVALAAAASTAACSWSNKANRPVWNAFEQHLVPAHDGAFYATLPLTVPVGLVAIVTDAVIAHPIQVLDDAVGDAGTLWNEDGPDFQSAYYTELAFLPLRVVATPLFFGGSFLGRVLFDIPERMSAEERERARRQRLARQRAAADERRRRASERFRGQLAAIGDDPERTLDVPEQWDPSFAAPLQRALAGSALVRLRVHRSLLARGYVHFGSYDAEVGLRDPDPVVRHAVLAAWPRGVRPSPAALQALRGDPVDAVRELVERRFPR